MGKHSLGSTSAVDGWIEAAAVQRSVIGAIDVAALAGASGLGDGGARTRLLMAHLQEGDQEAAIALCSNAIGNRPELALFCHALLNHAPLTVRTARVLIKVVAGSLPTHSAARIKVARPIQVASLYDASWFDDLLVAVAPLADGFPESFDGALVNTEHPFLYHSTFTVARREGDKVFLSLSERSQFTIDDFWVAPPSIMIAGTLGPPKGRAAILQAKLRRGLRRLKTRLKL